MSRYDPDALIIDGAEVRPRSAQYIDIISPSTEMVIGRAPAAGPEDVAVAVEAARAAYERGDWRRMPVSDRAATLEKAVHSLEARTAEIAHLVGRVVAESRAANLLEPSTADTCQPYPEPLGSQNLTTASISPPRKVVIHMPITTIDPDTALIVVDLQSAAARMPTVHPFDGVLANMVRLADAFRAKHLPVVLVNVAGGAPGRTEHSLRASDLPAGWSDLLPELNQQPGDKTITKYTWGAFHNNDLAERLRELGVTQVVVCGLSTAIGVESTARQAHEHGFHVTLPIDAMTDLDAATHDNSIALIFPKLGETGTTADVLAQLGE